MSDAALAQALTWCAAVLTVVSLQLLAWRQRAGWAVQAVNGALWVVLMWRVRYWGLVALEAVLVAQALWALWKWRKTP